MRLLNPFLANVPILYPLKIIESQRFSGVFKGCKIRTLARNGLKITYYQHFKFDFNFFIIQEVFIYFQEFLVTRKPCYNKLTLRLPIKTNMVIYPYFQSIETTDLTNGKKKALFQTKVIAFERATRLKHFEGTVKNIKKNLTQFLHYK